VAGHRRFATSLAFALALAIAAGAAQAQPPSNDAERQAMLKTLGYHEGGKFTLPVSNAKLDMPQRYIVLIGADARKYFEIANGVDATDKLEAVVVDPRSKTSVYVSTTDEGYVALDDWSEINPDAMLRQMKQNTAASNPERKRNGRPALTVLDWDSKPALDRAADEVRYAIKLKADERELDNAALLVLGRNGYEKFTWTGDTAQDPRGLLAAVRAGFTFPPGATYADHQDGDKTASYGIAALVAAAVGAKILAKAGAFAFLLGFAKKGAVVVAGLALAAWRALRRKPAEPASP
jgi:uncharacterized membrane-anchored protein